MITRESAKLAGLKKYDTGEKCIHGHIAPRWVSNGRCVECNKITFKKWAANNVACQRERDRVWRKKNPDKVKASKRREYAKHRITISARGKAWYLANKHKIKPDPLRRRVNEANRRARGFKRLSVKDVSMLFQLQRGRCPVCRLALGEKYHIDHIVPLSKGGSGDRLNVQLLCPPCNQRKHAKDPIQFMREQGRLL